MTQAFFNARIASILRDNKYDRRIRNQRSGRVDMGKLYKTSFNSRVFTRKREAENKDYSFVIIIDESGSMSGRRDTVARTAATLALSLMPHETVNLAILGYSNRVRLIKPFDVRTLGGGKTRLYRAVKDDIFCVPEDEQVLIDERYVGEANQQTKQLAAIIGIPFEPMQFASDYRIDYNGGTPEHYAFEDARKLLATVGGKKMIISFTDGGVNDPPLSQLQSDAAKREGIKVVGFGVGGVLSAKAQYHSVSNGSYDHMNRLLTIISDFIQR